MRLNQLFARLLLVPLFDAPADGGGGAGAGAAGAVASGGGRGAGSGAPAAGASGGGTAGAGAAGAAGAGGGSAIRLTDDSVVDLGDGRSGRWGDLRGQHFMDRARYDAGVKLLQDAAGQLDQRERDLLARITAAQGGTRPDGSPNPPSDPFAALEDLPIVDGKTLAKYARELAKNGLGGLAQNVTALAARLQKLETGMSARDPLLARSAEADEEANFQRFVDESFGKLGAITGLPDGVSLPKDSPFLRELARDVWSSYTWKNHNEFYKVFADRVAGAIQMVRALDKAAIENGQKAKNHFLNSKRGNGTPRGEAPYRHENGTSLARRLFHNDFADRT